MSRIEARECFDVLDDCESVPFNQTLIPPFYDYLQDFTISRSYDVSLCLIPKVMSTIGTAALCYIDDPVAFSKANRTISTEIYERRFCEKNEMKSFEMVKHNLKKDFENIIVVRDPFDRFISGFTEKCVRSINLNLCHGCGADIRCFIRKEYRRLMRISMLFPVYTTADTHFAPQTWFCDMKNAQKNSKMIKYAKFGEDRNYMIEEIIEVLRSRKVKEENLNEVKRELSKGKTNHSTSGSSTRRLFEKMVREDYALRRAIIRMYYYDFMYLGYGI